MEIRELNPDPIPAIEDARFPHDDDETTSKQVAQVLCAEYGARNPMELVAQPQPSLGPRQFIIDSEKLRDLLDFEALTFKAVKSNPEAAFVFLIKFANQEFMQTIFHTSILDQAIETDRVGSLMKENLPNPNSNWEQYYTERIAKLKVMKRLIEIHLETGKSAFLLTIPKNKRSAATQLPKKFLASIKKLIKHNEFLLEKLHEIFAK